MSLFVMADLHLSGLAGKPMDVFGNRWIGYTDKIEKNWRAVIDPEDTVVIPGDISWGMSLEEALPDLLFLESLPGRKIVGRGNHDYWWATSAKMNSFLSENGIGSVSILFNNAYETEDFIIAGTRGWFTEDKQDMAPETSEYAKIVARETGRLKMSLDAAVRFREGPGSEDKEILVFFHFPPVFNGFVCGEFVELLREYGISRTYFGHIHGLYTVPRSFEYEGISFTLVSADYLGFAPMPVFPSYPDC